MWSVVCGGVEWGCEVWGVGCEVWGVWGVEYGMWSVGRGVSGMWSVEWDGRVWSVGCGVSVMHRERYRRRSQTCLENDTQFTAQGPLLLSHT